MPQDIGGGSGKVNRLEMDKVKEILRLNGLGFSYREIAASTGCGKSAVGETVRRAGMAGIKEADGLTAAELQARLFPERPAKCADDKEPDMPYLLAELSRKHVTRQLLWEEYKLQHPDGLMYSQFCNRIRAALKANEIDYRKIHKAGEECEVDWCGSAIPYFDKGRAQWLKAAVFVAVLPASAYPFARAYPDQRTASWIDAHISAFRFFSGVPRILVPDCTRTAVTESDLFDPVVSRGYAEMAAYYGATIIPARPGKPKDKGYVENTVGNVSRRIIASLRDERFTGIEEINARIAERLEALIDRPFQKMEGSRRSAFARIDKPALRPLPKTPYEPADFATCKVGINYHAAYEGFFYSVPFEYRGQECTVRATHKTIEVLVSGERVCAHRRHFTGNRYVTAPEHLPEHHKAVSDWNDERFISWAGRYGDNTTAYVKALLESCEYSVQAYRACMGVLREAKGQEAGLVEAASGMALESGQLSSRYFRLALRQKAKDASGCDDARIVEHANIRGACAFDRCGQNA